MAKAPLPSRGLEIVYATAKHQVWELNCEIHCIQRRIDMAKHALGCYVETDLALEHHASYNKATRQQGKVYKGEVLNRRADSKGHERVVHALTSSRV
jgi:hypothetical protein